jgi:Fic family protein
MHTFCDLDKHLGMLPAPLVNALTEIAGYRRVLDEIHTNAENIPFSENAVKQFHGWLYSFTPVRAGEYKLGDNEVTETRPDGIEVVRFQPVKKADTPMAMQELHESFDRAWATADYHRVLLLAAYVFDFLMIHPFQDGNGRMSRLMTSLLLYHSGIEVGRYVSWEKLIEESRETYYESLQNSTTGWHDGKHDLKPWLEYFLGVLVAAYAELERRVAIGSVLGSKSAAVKHFVRTYHADLFAVSDVRRVVPNIGEQHLGNVLRGLKNDGVLDREGYGKGSKWRIRRRDF